MTGWHAWLSLGAVSLSLAMTMPARAQETEPAAPAAPATLSNAERRQRLDAAVSRCVEFLLAAQEGDENAEWPYEGVYRVGGKIPVGYRIGGTSIVAGALMLAPGFTEDAARHQALARAVDFVDQRLGDPLMNPDYEGGYDVRGWGYTYALQMLLTCKSTAAIEKLPEELRPRIDERIRWCIKAIEQTEIAEAGGWNYARARGKDKVSPPSPFMTGPTLQALFEARQQGFEVDAGVVERGLKSLERGRASSGSISYSGDATKRAEPVPGSVGRMLASEITLMLAGRSDVARVRGALDSFLVHWEWLDARRAKSGTHEPPYGVAPYYFYYAHQQAAQAIELLPSSDRAEYRRRLHDKLFSVRLDDGTWNDRVFDRTANYGTSQALLCLIAPKLPPPARWPSAGAEKLDAPAPAASE
jgi:hypothetical protein